MSKAEYAPALGFVGGCLVKPMNETAAALCAKTLEPYYCPSAKDSPFPAQRMTWEQTGVSTLLVVPILVNRKFAGCILVGVEKVDGKLVCIFNVNVRPIVCFVFLKS